MTLLKGLWVSSWVGAAAALSWMVLLILARVAHDALQGSRDRTRAAIIEAYMALMHGDLGALDCQTARKSDPLSAYKIDPSGAGDCSRPAA
jgi:hypothetical protein